MLPFAVEPAHLVIADLLLGTLCTCPEAAPSSYSKEAYSSSFTDELSRCPREKARGSVT